ncbi:MAG: 4a-hydroxytetrahydrobiopterin dehydratase [Rickettsiales bacterium]
MAKETTLAQKKCTVCAPGTPPIDDLNARPYLEQVPGWELSLSNRAIKRRFVFKDFMAGLAFVNKVAEVAEAEAHHPDIMMGWGYVEIVLWTHTISGLHENDFIMAAKFNEMQPD